MTLVRRHYLLGGGGHTQREVVHHPGAVVVAPVDGDELLFVRQYRPAVERRVLELPAGLRDHPGESPEETAARECEEEVGYRPAHLRLLHRFYSSPGFTDEQIWLYLAEDLQEGDARPHGIEEESAELVRMTLSEAASAVRSGEVVDAKTLIGLYAAEAHYAGLTPGLP